MDGTSAQDRIDGTSKIAESDSTNSLARPPDHEKVVTLFAQGWQSWRLKAQLKVMSCELG